VCEAPELTSEEQWNAPVQLDDAATDRAHHVRLTVDTRGSVTAVWEGRRSGVWRIFSRRFNIDSGWEPTVALSATKGVEVHDPDVATLSDGTVVVVWRQITLGEAASSTLRPVDQRYFSLWGSARDASGNWAPAKLIEHDQTGSVSGAHIVAQRTGGAWIAFTQYDGFRYGLRTIHFRTPNDFSESFEVDEGLAGDAKDPRLLDILQGRMLLTWSERTHATSSLRFSTYDPVSGWSIPSNITALDVFGMDARPAFDPASGRVAALWSLGTKPALSLYDAAAGWDQGQVGSSESETALQLNIAHLDQHILGVWNIQQGKTFRIVGAGLSTQTRWGTLANVKEASAQLSDPVVVLGGNRGAAAWVSFSQNVGIVEAARWTPAEQNEGVWQAPVSLFQKSKIVPSKPQAIADCRGATAVAWEQKEGAKSHVWISSQR